MGSALESESDVILLFARDCPNVDAARESLRAAFDRVGAPASWRELDLGAPETPIAWRRFGSPTVLVGGDDVAADARASGSCCRVYDGARAPRADVIASALARRERSADS